jgi:hypothetical protein
MTWSSLPPRPNLVYDGVPIVIAEARTQEVR